MKHLVGLYLGDVKGFNTDGTCYVEHVELIVRISPFNSLARSRLSLDKRQTKRSKMKRSHGRQKVCRVRVAVKKSKRDKQPGRKLSELTAKVSKYFLLLCAISLFVTMVLLQGISSNSDVHGGIDPTPFEESKDAKKTGNESPPKEKWKHPDSVLINKLLEGHESYKKRSIAESKPEPNKNLRPVVIGRAVTPSKYSRSPTLFPPKEELEKEQSHLKHLNITIDKKQDVKIDKNTTTTVHSVTKSKPEVKTPAPNPGDTLKYGLNNQMDKVNHLPRDNITPLPMKRATTIFQGEVVKASMRAVDNFLAKYASIYNFSLSVAPDMVDNRKVKLPHTIPKVRNPCWLEEVPDTFHYGYSAYRCHVNYRKIMKGFDFIESLIMMRNMGGRKWRIRCFPSFFFIGVPKSGTQDLHKFLTKHPKIVPSEIKEPEYWSRQRFEISPMLFSKECIGAKNEVSFAEYLDVYDKAAEFIRTSLMMVRGTDELHSELIIGDYSTRTFTELAKWDRGQEAPPFISGHTIYSIRPESRFIILLRDPVERALSHYNEKVVRRKATEHGTIHDFHMKMFQEVKDTRDCMKTHSRRFCVYNEDFGRANYHSMLVTGLYIVYLTDWLSIIPKTNIYILRFEDYITDRIPYLADLASFLGLGSFPDDVISEIESVQNVPLEHHMGDMMNETRTMLRDFFRPYNRELAKLLQNDAFTWGY